MTTRASAVLPSRRLTLLFISILLIAASLRSPITAIGPLLEMIRDRFSLSGAEAGLLTTLPLLAFAVLSPVTALLVREYGIERTLFAALVTILAGCVMRSSGSLWALYLGTWIIGSGIAMGNVILPSLLKRDFPAKIIVVTTFYVLSMTCMAALASAAAVPLAQTYGLGWSVTLGLILIVPLLSAAVWIPQLRNPVKLAGQPTPRSDSVKVWRSVLAWQIAVYMGITCLVYYVAIAWLSAILVEAGYGTAQAGSLHGLMQLAGAAPGLILLPLLSRFRNQQFVAFASPMLGALGLAGLMIYPQWASVWVVLFGSGMSAALILSLAFAGLRATNVQQAAALSAMSQSAGYLLAALGPTLAGVVHDATDNWIVPLGGCAALCVFMAIIGLYAGRNSVIEDPAGCNTVPPVK